MRMPRGNSLIKSISRPRYVLIADKTQTDHLRIVLYSHLVDEAPGDSYALLDVSDDPVAGLEAGVVVQGGPDLGANLLKETQIYNYQSCAIDKWGSGGGGVEKRQKRLEERFHDFTLHLMPPDAPHSAPAAAARSDKFLRNKEGKTFHASSEEDLSSLEAKGKDAAKQ